MKAVKYLWIFVVLAALVMGSLGCGGSTTADQPTDEPGKPTQAAKPTKAEAEATEPAEEPTEAPAVAESLTALAAYKILEPAAQKWQSDAVLITLAPVTFVPLAADGTIQVDKWMAQFYSPSAGAIKNILLQKGQVQEQPEIANKMTDDRSIPNPGSLLDSDKALALAEKNGAAAARKENASIKFVQISLINDGDGTIKWAINYSAEDYSVKYIVQINAKDGTILLNTKL